MADNVPALCRCQALRAVQEVTTLPTVRGAIEGMGMRVSEKWAKDVKAEVTVRRSCKHMTLRQPLQREMAGAFLSHRYHVLATTQEETYRSGMGVSKVLLFLFHCPICFLSILLIVGFVVLPVIVFFRIHSLSPLDLRQVLRSIFIVSIIILTDLDTLELQTQ